MQPVIIQYNRGKVNVEVKEFNPQLNVSRNQKLHGNSCIVNNTCWHEDMEQTIKRREYKYYLMSNNDLFNI